MPIKPILVLLIFPDKQLSLRAAGSVVVEIFAHRNHRPGRFLIAGPFSRNYIKRRQRTLSTHGQFTRSANIRLLHHVRVFIKVNNQRIAEAAGLFRQITLAQQL